MVLTRSAFVVVVMAGFSIPVYGKTFELPSPKKTLTPRSVNELQTIVRNAYANNQKLSIAAGRYSQGSQYIDEKAALIDITQLKSVVTFDKAGKRITVQAGITWKEVPRVVQMAGLSVKTMPPYADFTVGGSLSTNAHGQAIQYSLVSDGVEKLKVMLADGTVEEVSPAKNGELFRGVLGGYGLMGIITEVTLPLVDNMVLQKNVKVLDASDYPAYFLTNIKDDKHVALHTARLTIAPSDLLNQVIAITYTNTTQKATHESFAEANQKATAVIKKDQQLFSLLHENKWMKSLRLFVDKNYLEKPEIISRNNVLAQTIDVKKVKEGTRNIVQEYLVPCCCFDDFVAFLRETILESEIGLLSVSVSYIKPSEHCMLTYATEEMFSFFLSVNVKEDEQSYSEASYWTQMLIDKATKLGGTYHLPYHPFAPRQLLKNAYPHWGAFIALKKKYDTREIFINGLYRKYA